jgi:hypothetical protein
MPKDSGRDSAAGSGSISPNRGVSLTVTLPPRRALLTAALGFM